MKKIYFSIMAFCAVNFVFAQHNTPWTNTISNASQSGYVGLGVRTTTSSTTLPNFNLQLHGTNDYTFTFPATLPLYDINGNVVPGTGSPSYTVNYGKTTRFGLTNATTGMLATDGTVLRMSDNHFVLHNQETNGTMLFQVNKALMRFEGSTGQVWVGGHTTTNVTPGIFNVFSGTNENGLFIRSVNNSSSHYGLRIQMSNASSNAIEVLNNTQTASSVNFRVKTNGFVYARKYTTTLTNFPDYVFDANYKLMPLSTLRTYIQTNKHLPNVPTAKQVEAEGADLGELNRVLVEKVEELTLYILQLEERLQKLEIQK